MSDNPHLTQTASDSPRASDTGPTPAKSRGGHDEPQIIGRLAGVNLEVAKGSILNFSADAIVCPANAFLQMRGGVSALLREKAGSQDQLEKDAITLGPIRVGDAVLTKGYALSARFVIHAPTVEMPVDRSSPQTVRLAMAAALRVASRHSIRTLATPALGTGTGGISYREAAELMLRETYLHLSSGEATLKRIVFVAWEPEFSEALFRAPFPPAVERLPPPSGASAPEAHVLNWVE